MAREPTLDEFLGGDEGDDGRAATADGATADGGSVPTDAGAAVDPDADPAAVTCEWAPGGRACEACGATVRRRWTDGGARVCSDCKEW